MDTTGGVAFMTRNELFSFCGFGIMAAVVLPNPDGALDSVGEFQQTMGLYPLDSATTPTPTPAAAVTVSTSDDHSWFAFNPTLLPIAARAPLSGRWVSVLSAPRVRFEVRVGAPPPPRERPARTWAPLVVRVPLAPVAETPLPVPALLGVSRVAVEPARATFTGWIEDPDEALLLAIAGQLQSRVQPVYLVDRRVAEEEFRLALLAALETLA